VHSLHTSQHYYYYETQFNFLSNLASTTDQLIILDDFNFPDIDWDSLSGHLPASNQFCDLVFQSSLSQLAIVSVPTHNQGNILDLVLTKKTISLIYKSIQFQCSHLIISTLLFHCLPVLRCLPIKPTTYFTFNYMVGDYQGLHDFLCGSNFSPCYASDDVEYIWHIIESQITAGMELFIPVNKFHSDQHPYGSVQK